MKYSNIRVLCGASLADLDKGRCDDVQEFDTVAAAKKWAHRVLTADYAKTVEMSAPFNVSRVKVEENGHDCILEEFERKGYVRPVMFADAAND